MDLIRASLEIPAFLRRKDNYGVDKYAHEHPIKNAKSLKVIAAHDTTDDEIAELIYHLSNVYKSVGGDELVINNVKNIPPGDSHSKRTHAPQKKGNAK